MELEKPQDERRLRPRQGTWQQVEFATAGYECVAALLDISATGARLCVKNGFIPARGEEIVICLIDGTRLDATIAWQGHDDIGVTFKIPLLDVNEHLHFDHLGYDYLRATLRIQKKRHGRQLA